VPFIAAISHAKGTLTFSEAGKLTYVKYGITSHTRIGKAKRLAMVHRNTLPEKFSMNRQFMNLAPLLREHIRYVMTLLIGMRALSAVLICSNK
jgi:hypothetical protein